MTTFMSAAVQFLEARRACMVYEGRAYRDIVRRAKRVAASLAWVVPIMEARGFDVLEWNAHRIGIATQLFNALDAVRFPVANEHHDDCDALAGWDSEYIDDLENLGNFDAAQFITDAAQFEYVVTEDDKFVHTDDTWMCERFDHRYSNEAGSYEVNVRRGTEMWCEEACDEYAFFCYVSEEYYSNDYYTSGLNIADDDTLCVQHVERRGWYYHGDGYWGEEPPSGVDEDDEDDEERETHPIAHYHNHAVRRWTYDLANRSMRAFYGFEIELCFESHTARYEFYNALDRTRICGERDGSLHPTRGMELITCPLPMSELRKPDNWLKGTLEEAGEVAGVEDEHDNVYGVHITTNWGRLTASHCERLRAAAVQMKSLTVFVARRETAFAKFNLRTDDKHVAVNIRDRLAAEFRVFKSTTDWPTLMSYVEYIDALTEWTRDPANAIAGGMAQAAFRRWVIAGKQYPFLAQRLAGKTTLLLEAA